MPLTSTPISIVSQVFPAWLEEKEEEALDKERKDLLFYTLSQDHLPSTPQVPDPLFHPPLKLKTRAKRAPISSTFTLSSSLLLTLSLSIVKDLSPVLWPAIRDRQHCTAVVPKPSPLNSPLLASFPPLSSCHPLPPSL